MEQAKLIAVNRCIQDAVQQAVNTGGISGPAIEGFLRTGEETWDGAGSGRFTLAQVKRDGIYSGRAKAALRALFDRLASLLPPEAKMIAPVAPETIRQHVDPMVKGLVQADWQEVALRELTRRTFPPDLPWRQRCH
jgi:hypothetical protein